MLSTHKFLILKDMVARCIASFLPKQYNPATFAVCGTITSAANERSRLRRQALPWRVMSPDMLMFALYILYASLPLLAWFQPNNTLGTSGTDLRLFPFPGLWVKLLRSISNVSVPLRYMIWPPTVPERADLLEEDEDGVKRPRKAWDRSGGGNEAWWIGTVIVEVWIILWCF